MKLSAIEAKHVQRKLQEFGELQDKTSDIPFFKLKKRNKTKINIPSGLKNLPCKVEPCSPFPQFSSDGNNFSFDKSKFQDFLNNHPIIKDAISRMPEGNSMLVWLKSPQQVTLPMNLTRMGFPTSKTVHTVHGNPLFLNSITASSFLDQWHWWVKSGWLNTIKAGGISLAVSFISGLLDSMIDHVFEGYPMVIKWSKRILGSLILIVSVIFLAFAIYFVVVGSLPILSFFITLFVSIVASVIGWWLAKRFAQFLSYILPESFQSLFQLKSYFNEDIEMNDIDEQSCETEEDYSYSLAIDKEEQQHRCGPNVDGYLNVGKCHICYKNPATMALVHEGYEVAHTTYCSHCWDECNLHTSTLCTCGVKVVSHFEVESHSEAEMKGINPICTHGNCIYVGECNGCIDEGLLPAKTVTSYRATLNEEKRIVDVELVYCHDHKPKKNVGKYCYGSVFGFGYSKENQSEFSPNHV